LQQALENFRGRFGVLFAGGYYQGTSE